MEKELKIVSVEAEKNGIWQTLVEGEDYFIERDKICFK